MERFSPSLFSDLERFLRNPVVTVRVVDANEVAELQRRLEHAEQEAARAVAMYGRELSLNNRLVEILRDNGINWR